GERAVVALAPCLGAVVELPADDDLLVVLAHHGPDMAIGGGERRVAIADGVAPHHGWAVFPVREQVPRHRPAGHAVAARATELRPTGVLESAGFVLEDRALARFFQQG